MIRDLLYVRSNILDAGFPTAYDFAVTDEILPDNVTTICTDADQARRLREMMSVMPTNPSRTKLSYIAATGGIAREGLWEADAIQPMIRNHFDAVLCFGKIGFETPVSGPEFESLVYNLTFMLRPGGVLLVSVPSADALAEMSVEAGGSKFGNEIWTADEVETEETHSTYDIRIGQTRTTMHVPTHDHLLRTFASYGAHHRSLVVLDTRQKFAKEEIPHFKRIVGLDPAKLYGSERKLVQLEQFHIFQFEREEFVEGVVVVDE